MERIVLAYSGGLYTSIAIRWIIEHSQADVIAVTLDIGQGRDLAEIRERALALGASRAHVIDAREPFVRSYILPALQAGALVEQPVSLAAALVAPLLARTLVDVAHMERASAVAHGCGDAPGSQARLESAVRALDPDLGVLAPARTWGTSRLQALEFARSRNIPLPPDDHASWSCRSNVWGRTVRGGGLDDPWREPPDVYTLTRAATDCPDEPACVELELESGVPVRINGVDMSLLEILESLETIAGAHGVGRLDGIAHEPVRSGPREVSEAPAAVVLCAAHEEIEKLVLAPELRRLKQGLARGYADLVYKGDWFSPVREPIDAFVATIQKRVTGTARFRFFKGGWQIIGRQSPLAPYDPQARASDAARPSAVSS
jgi:argininosuccinate synthase